MVKSEGERSERSGSVSFNSEDIAARDGKKLFTNVEGAAEREREAKKQLELEEKAKEKQHENLVKNAISEEKTKAREASKAKKAERKQKEQSGRKKSAIFPAIIAAIIGAAICIVAAICLFLNSPENQTKLDEEDYRKAFAYAQQIYVEADSLRLGDDSSYDDAIALFEKEIENAENSAQKVYYSIYYARYVVDITNNLDRAEEILNEAKTFSEDEFGDSLIDQTFMELGIEQQ